MNEEICFKKKDNEKYTNDKNSVNESYSPLNSMIIIENEMGIREHLTRKEIFMFILKNSFFIIWSKLVFSIMDNTVFSFIGHLTNATLKSFLISHLIQNVFFRSVGYGLTFATYFLCIKNFDKNKFSEIGQTINRATIILYIFAAFSFIITIFSDFIFKNIFPEINIKNLKTYLVHNHLSIILDFHVKIFYFYLISQNNYIIPAVFDSISCISQFCTFKFLFGIDSNLTIDINDSLFFTIAWAQNGVFILQFLMYFVYINIYKPFPNSNICVNKKSILGLGKFFKFSLLYVSIFFFHFLNLEYVNFLYILCKKEGYEFIGLLLSEKYSYIIQSLSLGFFLVLVKIGINIKKKSYNGFLSRFTKHFFIFSISIILLFILFTIIFSDFIFTLYSDNKEVKEFFLTYLRTLVIILIPYHIVISLQSILIANEKHNLILYTISCVTVGITLPLGYMLIFSLGLEIKGILITLACTQSVLGIIFFIFVKRIKSFERIDEDKYSII